MRLALATFLLASTVGQGIAQNLTDIPLIEVIRKLEEEYQVRFSYVDELVANRMVSIDLQSGRNLGAILEELQRKLKIRFEQVNFENILIRNFSSGDRIKICGYVREEDGPAIPDLIIRTGQDNNGTVTDNKGYFEVTVPYDAIMTFHHLGFVTKRRVAHVFLSFECVDIYMKAAFSLLEELTISDYLTVGITRPSQKGVRIFPQKLKILPGLIEPDILQTIQQTPGVNSPYETATGIHVRGGAPDQNLVLWNDIKTYNQGHFFGMLSAFNPYITNQVDFIKNGTHPRYGGRISGVIDIRTSDEVPKAVEGGAGFNMLYGDAYLNVPVVKDKLSILTSVRRSYTDVLETFTYNQLSKRVFQNTKITEATNLETGGKSFYFNDFNSNVVFQPGKKDRISLSTLYTKNDLDFSSYDEGSQSEFRDRLRTENEGYSLRWDHYGGKIRVGIGVNYANYLLQYRFLNTQNDTSEISSKKNLINDIGARSEFAYSFSESHEVSAGYELAYNTTRYAFEDDSPLYHLVLDEDDRTIQTHAAYTTYQFDNGKTLARVGARGSYYYELDKWYIEPRVFLKQPVFKSVYITVSGEYRTQVISQIKESVVSDLSLENQVWKLAAKDRFPVITSYQVTSGLGFDKNDWYLDGEVFFKKMEGVTSLTFGFLNPIDNEYRSGNSTVRGADVFLKKEIKNYKSWVGYSYIFAENKFFGLNSDEPFPGNWNIEHQIKWSHFYTWNSLQLSLGWTWHTGKAFTEVIEENTPGTGPLTIRYGGINEQNLPVYHRLDFSALYDFTLKGHKKIRYRLGLSILNVYNRRNILNREFRTTPTLQNELIDTRVYSLRITPNLVFRAFW